MFADESLYHVTSFYIQAEQYAELRMNPTIFALYPG
jgi:hypothetical protein